PWWLACLPDARHHEKIRQPDRDRRDRPERADVDTPPPLSEVVAVAQFELLVAGRADRDRPAGRPVAQILQLADKLARWLVLVAELDLLPGVEHLSRLPQPRHHKLQGDAESSRQVLRPARRTDVRPNRSGASFR